MSRNKKATKVGLNQLFRKYSPCTTMLQVELEGHQMHQNDDLVYLDELPINSVFKYRGKRFIKIEKKRKRYLCECVSDKRNYLFVSHARVLNK